jgi:hypothetical protein
MDIEQLRRASLAQINRLFRQLPASRPATRQGFFRARFIGPGWLRASAGPSIALSGLRGWQGKRFIDAQQATNVLQGGREKLQMRCVEARSLVDGRLGTALRYAADAAPPWRWVCDELRELDDNTLLGMTVVDLPLLRRLPMPFLLQRQG